VTGLRRSEAASCAIGRASLESNRFKSSALLLQRQGCLFEIFQKESVMHRNIGTAAVAFVLFIGASGLSLAAETAAPSTKGGGDPTAEGIGNTSSTHNPNPNPASRQTGMENSGTEMGTDSSTHNPTGKKD
jgi:hypothetical protein